MWSSAISSQFLILVFITAFIKDTIAYFVTVRYHIQISNFKTAFKKYISKTHKKFIMFLGGCPRRRMLFR